MSQLTHGSPPSEQGREALVIERPAPPPSAKQQVGAGDIHNLLGQINQIVPGKPAQDIKEPGFIARSVGYTASLGAKLLIWLDASVYSMLSWWGPDAMRFVHGVFHVAVVTTLTFWISAALNADPMPRHAAAAAATYLAFCVSIGLVLQFMLYAFEFSLMSPSERVLAEMKVRLENDVKDGITIIYRAGEYRITANHERPKLHRCAYLWPLTLAFVAMETVAHVLLVFRDYALGNRFGQYVLLPTDWVEYYQEVQLGEYKNLVPRNFIRRMEQVIQDEAVTGQAFVLVPFGLMPGSTAPFTAEALDSRWNMHLADIVRPKGDPVLAIRLNDETKYGRMLVVGHWMTLATAQKVNILSNKFWIAATRVGG